jgi:hypothetical protein
MLGLPFFPVKQGVPTGTQPSSYLIQARAPGVCHWTPAISSLII